MKICPKCGAQMEDQAVFCANCGTNYNNPYNTAAPVTPEWDHTAEFDPKDVSDNKVIAMLVYLLSVVGILIALLSQNSPYVSFHVRQALKFLVVETLVGLVTAILCWNRSMRRWAMAQKLQNKQRIGRQQGIQIGRASCRERV